MGEGVGITPFCGPADLAVFAGIRQPWARLRWIRCGLVIARGFSLSGLLRAAGHVACLWRCTDGQKPGPCAGVRSATCAADASIEHVEAFEILMCR